MRERDTYAVHCRPYWQSRFDFHPSPETFVPLHMPDGPDCFGQRVFGDWLALGFQHRQQLRFGCFSGHFFTLSACVLSNGALPITHNPLPWLLACCWWRCWTPGGAWGQFSGPSERSHRIWGHISPPAACSSHKPRLGGFCNYRHGKEHQQVCISWLIQHYCPLGLAFPCHGECPV